MNLDLFLVKKDANGALIVSFAWWINDEERSRRMASK
jgi:hypothetical protein